MEVKALFTEPIYNQDALEDNIHFQNPKHSNRKKIKIKAADSPPQTPRFG